jgi:hypothetical protein
MKKNLFLLFAISVCLSAVYSCSKEDAPASSGGQLGRITSDRTRYVVGQLVTFSCPVTEGQNLLSTKYTFVFQNNVEDEASVENGVATYSYTPDKAGEITVKFKQLSVGIDGKSHTVESQLKLSVIEYDFCNSFWGDDVEECLKNNPDLIGVPGLPDDYSIESDVFKYGYGGSTYTLEVYNEIHFFFKNGKLDYGRMSIAPIPEPGLSKFYQLYVSLDLSKNYTKNFYYNYGLDGFYGPISDDLYPILSRIKSGDFTVFNEEAKIALVNEAMSIGTITLLYTGQRQNTEIRFTASRTSNYAYYRQVE